MAENGREAVSAKEGFLELRQGGTRELCRRMSSATPVLYQEIEVADLLGI
jgi:hypothetical protein